MRSWRVEKVTLVLVCAVLAGALAAYGQGVQTGAITGIVKDPNGAAVPNAKVEIYNLQTAALARSLTSDSDGGYSATLLPPGKYRVEVTIGGFKKHSATEVAVRLNETTRHDVHLEMGTVTETVVVEATATMINTTSATTGQPVDSRTLSALPLPVPNFLFLLTLSTGTAGEPPDVRAANRGIVDINVNGQRTTNNSVSLEGINVNDFNLAHFDTIPLPNANTVSEFKVATSLYDASAGSKGGGALGLVLKSGTKDIHWEAYWNHRNDVLNANEWFRNQTNQSRARLLQNVFGASGSGPFWGVGGFWFLNYQGVRARNGIDRNGSALSPRIQNIPTQADGTTTAALLAATFSTTSFPIAPADIDPVAVNILNVRSSAYGATFLVPRSGDPGCQTATTATASFVCQFSAVTPLNDDQYTITYDRPFRSDKDRLSVRWFFDNGAGAKPYGTAGTLAFPRGEIQRNRFISTNYLYQITPRQLNDFRFGYSRFNASFSPTDSISLADIGATRPNEAEFPGMYFITISGLFSTGVGVNDDRGTISNSYYWADTWSMTAGKHTFRAGGEVAYYQLNRFNRFATRGSLTFGGFGTGSATAFQTFLTGRPTALQSAGGDPQRYFRNTDVFVFFQDDWKIHPRWTVNLGLRWEGLGFSREKLNRLGNYDPALLLAQPPRNPFFFPEETNLAGFTGTPGTPGCVLERCRDINNFAPRVSFAWDMFGNQRTVVRAGYGIYYQRLSNQNILQANLSPPFNVQNIESRPTAGTSPPFQLQDPFPTLPPAVLVDAASIPQLVRFAGLGRVAPSGPGGTTCPATSAPLDVNDPCNFPLFINEVGQFCVNFSPLSVPASQRAGNCVINLASFTAPPFDTRAPYTQQWNLTIQRDLWRGWVVEAGYIGASNVGGIGIFNPFVRLASPSNPITVTDINGTTHTVTLNTVRNEPLRHAILGLSRTRGTRFSGNVGKSIYHSAQLTLSRRFQGGLYFQGAYTWSKLIDNVSGSQSTDELNITRAGQGGGNLFDLGNIDPRRNRAIGDFDRPHRLIVSYNWEISVPKSGMWNNQVFQGWGISGIVTFQNGLPFSITDPVGGGAFGSGGLSSPSLICAPAFNPAFPPDHANNANNQLPNLPSCTPGTPTTVQQALLGGDIQGRLDNFINPNMFSSNASVDAGGSSNYGNVPRNAFRAPFQQNWDFSLTKSFRFSEKLRLQFRTDFFNMWNHPIFQTPSSVSIGTRSTFGEIVTTAIPARLIQFGLRLNY